MVHPGKRTGDTGRHSVAAAWRSVRSHQQPQQPPAISHAPQPVPGNPRRHGLELLALPPPETGKPERNRLKLRRNHVAICGRCPDDSKAKNLVPSLNRSLSIPEGVSICDLPGAFARCGIGGWALTVGASTCQ